MLAESEPLEKHFFVFISVLEADLSTKNVISHEEVIIFFELKLFPKHFQIFEKTSTVFVDKVEREVLTWACFNKPYVLCKNYVFIVYPWYLIAVIFLSVSFNNLGSSLIPETLISNTLVAVILWFVLLVYSINMIKTL